MLRIYSRLCGADQKQMASIDPSTNWWIDPWISLAMREPTLSCLICSLKKKSQRSRTAICNYFQYRLIRWSFSWFVKNAYRHFLKPKVSELHVTEKSGGPPANNQESKDIYILSVYYYTGEEKQSIQSSQKLQIQSRILNTLSCMCLKRKEGTAAYTRKN